MLNLLIVDDEPMFREGLIKTMQWDVLGFSIVGEAYNGIAALKFLERKHVDLIITDIRMPEMDGLELIRRATVHNPEIRFIVLSALDDFHLVKQAFQLGIVDYILKSDIRESELKEILDRQAQEFARRRTSLNRQNTVYVERNNRLMLQQLLRNCVDRKLSLKEFPELQEYFNLTGENLVCSVALCIHYTDYSVSAEDVSEYLSKGVLIIESLIIAKKGWLSFSEKNYLYLFYVLPDHTDWSSFYNNTERFRRELQQRLQKDNSFYKITSGFSSLRKSSILSRQKTEAEKACKFSFFRGIGRSISYQHYQNSLDKSEPDYHNLLKEFGSSLKIRNIKRIKENLRHYQVSPPNTSGSAQQSIKGLYRKYFYQILTFCEELGIDDKRISNRYHSIEICSAPLTQLNIWFESAINLIMDKTAGYRSLIRLVISYLGKNYNKDLSLTEVAGFFHVNSSYLSRRFSNEVGTGFSSYLTELRINRALELLEKTNLKIYEIAEQVGILNPESFSRIFKKTTGYSPREYLMHNKSYSD